MAKPIFEYQDYKAYLRDLLAVGNGNKRGERSRMAAFVDCHTAYVSQVLNGRANFSLEQGDQINRFFAHSKDQSLFFIYLIQYARAGTTPLKYLFEEQLQKLKEKQFVLKDRLEYKKSLSREDQAIFYSSWHYGAVHVLVSVPSCHTEKGMARYLRLPVERVAEILNFLVSVGLVVHKEEGYSIGTTHIHLEHDAPMIAKHHTNWRVQAIQSLDQVHINDLHYSSVITCSRSDSDRIKAILIKAIERVRAVVKTSSDDEGFCYAVDLFDLRRGSH